MALANRTAAITLYFQGFNGSTDWFNADNWYTGVPGNLTPYNHVPSSDDAVEILTPVDAANPVQIFSLIVDAGGRLNSGNYTADYAGINGTTSTVAQLGGNNATLLVNSHFTISGNGMNIIASGTLIIGPNCLGAIQKDNQGHGGVLTLQTGGAIQNQGTFHLFDGSNFTGAGNNCSLKNTSTGTFLASGTVSVSKTSGAFTVDSDGVIGMDGGTLTFGAGITWASTNAKLLRFVTIDPNGNNGGSIVVTDFIQPAGVAVSFIGPGSGTSNGAMQTNGAVNIGGPDPKTNAFSKGSLLIAGTVTGTGAFHVISDGTLQSRLVMKSAPAPAAQFLSSFTGSVTIDSGALFAAYGALAGTINNSGEVDLNGLTMAGGTVLSNLSGGSLNMFSGQVLNGGTPKAQITNAGTATAYIPYYPIEITPDFTNTGTVKFGQQSGNLMFHGKFTQTAGVVDNISIMTGDQGFDLNGGSFIGSGEFDGQVRNNGGTFSPGHSPGQLSIQGSYIQGTNGNLAIEVAGVSSPGIDFDQLRIYGSPGTAALGGTLHVTDINGFTPSGSDTVTFLTATGGVSGTFTSANTQVTYGSSSLTAAALPSGSSTPTPTPTPTPSATASPGATPAQLLNISTRMEVLTGSNVLIGGFIVTGTDAKKILVRGLGPSLPVGSAALADPTLELHDSTKTLQTDDNWQDTQAAAIQATGIPPANPLESALIATLPGNNSGYTAILTGKNGGTGIGLVEVYDLAQAANSKLANISTRGFVDIGDNVMIGGLILGPTGTGAAKILVRAIGPSLTAQNVAGALQDPTLELHDANGGTIATNDNWKVSDSGGSQQADIQATTIPPTDDRESALVRTLAPGNYTAIVKGKGGTTGVALVELYNLN